MHLFCTYACTHDMHHVCTYYACIVCHNPDLTVIIFFYGKIGWFLVSSSKTTHSQRKRWAPSFNPCPRGVHWWQSRPNWLSWRRETWLGPSKKCHLRNHARVHLKIVALHGSEQLAGTARGNRGSDVFFSAPELKN